MRSPHPLLPAALAALAPFALAAQPKAPQVPFLSPQEALDKMTVKEGFSVTAFAAEPDLVQPFAFCFDDRGRIWVTENLNYETRGSDLYKLGPVGRIIILEDTDGDGVFDKKKVFHDKITFPTGLELGFGGVWVGSPPNLLFIPDRDGDDVPDGEPEVLLDGWGRQDRHETLNSFMWGPDGWLYGLHGVFTHSRVGKPGTPDKERAPINAGVWRYHPTKKKFEVFAWGTSNPWGMDFDDHGQCFITACVIPHLWHMIQGGRYHRQGGRHFNPHVYDDIKTIADHRHKSAHGGARFYLADAFPEKYRGRLFMGNIHQHDIMTDVLERRGSGFVGKHGDDFLQSNDPQYLGFNMDLGPDGAIYVIDWHDADICGRKVVHPDTGRLYRVAYKGTKPALGLDLAAKTDAELVALHLHPNEWYVRHARRILQERAAAGELSADTRGALLRLFRDQASVPKKLRALWTLHATAGVGEKALTALLDHEAEYVRAWAIQLLAEDGEVSRGTLHYWVKMAREDPSPVVRLYLASALQRIPPAKRWEILGALVTHEEDRDDHNLPLMYWYALEPMVPLDTKAALVLAQKAKVPRLPAFVARRIAAGAAAKPKPEARKSDPPARVKPAASVSREALALRLMPDTLVFDNGERVSQWNDGLRQDRHPAQADGSRQPAAAKKLGGRAAVRFDGDDDHLALPHTADLAFGSKDSYTLSAWVYVERTKAGWQAVIAKSRDRGDWYGLWIDPAGRWCFGTDGNNLAGPAAAEGWHHLCAVQVGGKERYLYLDGARVATDKARASDGPGDLWIGGAKGVREFFHGALGEVRIYRRALPHPEVARLAGDG